MPAIASLRAKEILDSRGNPTIHVTLSLDTGEVVETSVPNGIRRYAQESFVLYDQDPHHMDGRGVGKAVALINQTIGPQLVGQDPTRQQELDQWLLQLDNTPQKTQAGANTFAAISQALLKAGAAASGLPLYHYLLNAFHLAEGAAIPVCLYGLINGGQYGAGNLDIQEFMIIPASHIDYRVSLEIESTIRGELQRILQNKKANYSTGELGGFTPFLQKNSDVFELIIEATRNTPYILSRDFFFGIDSGAEMMADRGKYALKDKSTVYSEKELLEYYRTLRDQYNLTYFEDPFATKDADSWRAMTEDLSDTTRIAGDILTATNPKLVQQAVQNHLCNTLVVKPSQIGTITETLDAIRTARAAGWGIVISQRTGETNDEFLADFAVGVGAEFIKFGPTNRGEAVSKYNRLADIYREIERAIAQGATPMTEPTQSTQSDAAAVSTAPTEPQPTIAPPADPMAGETPMNTPVSMPAPAAPTEPAPVAAPMPPTTPPVTPPAAPDTPDISQPVAVGTMPPATPPSSPPVAPAAPTDGLPLPTMPPAAPTTPAASPEPTAPDSKPIEADMQKTIDSTLAEIGAAPTAPAAPTEPTAPAEPEPTV